MYSTISCLFSSFKKHRYQSKQEYFLSQFLIRFFKSLYVFGGGAITGFPGSQVAIGVSFC